MRTFEDNAGRTWTVEVNVAALKRAKGLAGVDLMGVLDGDLIDRDILDDDLVDSDLVDGGGHVLLRGLPGDVRFRFGVEECLLHAPADRQRTGILVDHVDIEVIRLGPGLLGHRGHHHHRTGMRPESGRAHRIVVVGDLVLDREVLVCELILGPPVRIVPFRISGSETAPANRCPDSRQTAIDPP